MTKRRLFLWFSTFLQLFNFLASSLSDSSESFVIPPPSTKVSLSGWKKIKSTVLITNQLFVRNLVKLQHVKFKVHTFWEGHKTLRNLHLTFVLCGASQKYGGDFAKFCGLLRIYELYIIYLNLFMKLQQEKPTSLIFFLKIAKFQHA